MLRPVVPQPAAMMSNSGKSLRTDFPPKMMKHPCRFLYVLPWNDTHRQTERLHYKTSATLPITQKKRVETIILAMLAGRREGCLPQVKSHGSVVFLVSNAWFTQRRQQVLLSQWRRGWWSCDFGAVMPLDLKGVIVQPLSVLAAGAGLLAVGSGLGSAEQFYRKVLGLGGRGAHMMEGRLGYRI